MKSHKTPLLVSGYLFLMVIACTGSRQIEIAPPAGYREIEKTEYTSYWIQFQEQYPHPDWAEGDYDGDGKTDRANMWIRADGIGWVLMAYLSSQPTEPIELFRTDRRPWSRVVCTIPPGEHKTLRYYGIGLGGPDTTTVITLICDAINLARFESEDNVFVWDKDKREFHRVEMP